MTQSERLRRHREELQLALRENISLEDARSRLAQQRWQATMRGSRTATARAYRPSWTDGYDNY